MNPGFPFKYIKAFHLFAIITLILVFFEKSKAQTYPYWDAISPGMQLDGYAPGDVGPILATTNAVYALESGESEMPDAVARWTVSSGWETLNGLTIDDILWGANRDLGMMTVHDHYLYVVGLFSIAGYTNSVNESDLAPLSNGYGANYVQIARFDFNTGIWSPLGQNFSATNVICPTTIAVDSSNNIYVGFAVWSGDTTGTNGFGGQLADLVDVSTNNGTNWQCLGGGFYVVTLPGLPGSPSPTLDAVISAMTADGTNVYIGGDFSGSTNGPSPHIVMWAGNNWRDLDGVPIGSDGFEGYSEWYTPSDWGYDTINSIVSIGTNIYAAGSFESLGSPNYSGLVRFSNITGHSLPTGDPADFLGWSTNNYYGATALAVNNGTLYFGGVPEFDLGSSAFSFASLSDPQDPSPSEWTNLSTNSANSFDVSGVQYLAAATNGNAVYVYGSMSGQDSFGNSSGGFSRLLTGPDGPCPSAYITNGDVVTNTFTFTAIGTPGSRWQVLKSTDTINWSDIGAVTLWGGSNTFTDTGYSVPAAYKLTDNCGESSPFSSATVVNVQFGNMGDPVQAGIAGTGVFNNDYWNVVPGATNFDQYGRPIYLTGVGIFSGYAVTEANLFDEITNASGITIYVMNSQEGGDAPYTQIVGDDPNPLINENLDSAGGPSFQLGLSLPENGHTYDVYLYSVTEGGVDGRYPATFTITDYSGSSGGNPSSFSPETPSSANYPTDTFVEGNQYVVFRGLVGGSWIINVYSGIAPVANGAQIVVH